MGGGGNVSDAPFMSVKNVATSNIRVTFSGEIYYSYDKKIWRLLSASSTIILEVGKSVYYKNQLDPTGSSIGRFTFTGNVELGGTPMSLIYGDDTSKYHSLKGYSTVFQRLFRDCSSIVQVESDFLPATELEERCYDQMFYNCYNIEIAPDLPATMLANYCYTYMFYGCKKLVTVSDLPAKILSEYCYDNMFSQCDALADCPKIEADILAKSCCYEMFYGCDNIKIAPPLPATTLADTCYSRMFYDCSNLIEAPELPATTLASSCYSNMFYNCTSLVKVPDLPATTLAQNCYNSMFKSCTKLAVAQSILPATKMEFGCYADMFSYCHALTIAPALPATTLEGGCYSEMFQHCSKLEFVKMMAVEAPGNNTRNWLYGVASTGTFVKNIDATWDVVGSSGVPEGWTIETAAA